jgi:hypothetical protein
MSWKNISSSLRGGIVTALGVFLVYLIIGFLFERLLFNIVLMPLFPGRFILGLFLYSPISFAAIFFAAFINALYAFLIAWGIGSLFNTGFCKNLSSGLKWGIGFVLVVFPFSLFFGYLFGTEAGILALGPLFPGLLTLNFFNPAIMGLEEATLGLLAACINAVYAFIIGYGIGSLVSFIRRRCFQN